MRWTIRRKLILSISIPLLATYLVVLLWDYHSQREVALQVMQEMVLTRANLTAGVINAKLEQAEQLARSGAGVPANRAGNLEQAGRLGQMMPGWQSESVSDAASRPARRVRGATGLFMELSGQATDFVVLNAQREFVYHPGIPGMPDVPSAMSKQMPDALAFGFQKAVNGEANVVRAERLGLAIPAYKVDEDYWVAFVPIPTTGWVFATAVSETETMRPVLALMGQRAALLLTGLIIMMLCVYLVSVRFCVPLERMAKAVERLGKGDLETRVPEGSSGDEVAQLSNGFNAMVGQIRHQMEDIRRAAVAREKVEGELRIARQIQVDLLPRTFPPFPHRKEFDLHAVNLPAAHVAGDFYDFFFVDEHRLMLVIADVSGKGMPAAIMMAVTRTIIRNLAMTGKTPLDIVRHANQVLVKDSPGNMFVTMIIAEYDTETGELRYVNAGHCPPMVIRDDGAVEGITYSTSPLVGATDWPDEMFTEATLQLAPGEVVVMFTDGVTEARNPAGDMLQEKGLMKILEKRTGIGAEAICNGIVAATNAYQTHHLADDLTLLVLRRAG